MKTQNFYNVEPLMLLNTTYAISFGERSRGKTYSSLLWGLKNIVVKSGYTKQFAYVRRWDIDFQGKRGKALFDALVVNGEIEKVTNGEWNSVYYYSGRWWFEKIDDDGKKTRAEEPFAYAFAINTFEHDKSVSYPNIDFIIFDEFISRNQYIGDEFNIFLNVLSTIIRYRDNVRVLMLGNTVSQENPYFHEMGIYYKAKTMKPGDTIQFKSPESEMTIALEFTDNNENGKPSDIYFDFKTSGASMITSGAWEIGKYPRLPFWVKIKPMDIVFKYFIVIYDEILQCEVIEKENMFFTYIHKKTTPIQDEDYDIVFSTEQDPRFNWRRDILRPFDDLGKKIKYFFTSDSVFYQDNETGELVNVYLNYFNN